MKQAAQLLLVFALVSVVCACSQGPQLKDQVSDEFAEQGLHPVRSSGFESAYVRPGADLPAYRSLVVAPLDVANLKFARTAESGTTRRDWQMTPERARNLDQGWQAAMARAFASYDLSGDSDRTLRVTAALNRVESGRSSTSSMSTAVSPAMTGGNSVDISAEFRVYDSASGDLLAVIRDRRTHSQSLWLRAQDQDMVNLFNPWAALLHTRLSGQ